MNSLPRSLVRARVLSRVMPIVVKNSYPVVTGTWRRVLYYTSRLELFFC